jgi:hypothetical protein
MDKHGNHLQHLSQLSHWTIRVLAGVVLFSMNASAQNAPLEPPPGPIYLGAYVNPKGLGESVEVVQAFETSINRTLALNVHYHEWTELGENFPSTLEKDDLAKGRIPVVSWNCGAPNGAVASGSLDPTIIAAARAIQSYGGPVLLRYMGGMNLADTANNRTVCHGPNDNPDGHFSSQDFVAAWRHIRRVFACPNASGPCRPVTNVVWLWNPAAGAPFAAYYPGDNEVDWVGVEALDFSQPSAEDQFSATISPLYSELTALAGAKPILLQTAALHGNQVSYLNTDAPVRSLKNNFPDVKGLIYYDSKDSDFDWTLDNQGGYCAFIILALTPYLSAMEGLTGDQGTPPPLCCTCMLPAPGN